MAVRIILFLKGELFFGRSAGCNYKVKIIQALYEQYANNQIGATAPTTWSKPTEEGSQSKQKKSTLFAEFKEFEGTSVCIAGKSKLDLYLEEKKLNYQTFHEMDVIKYWKDNEKKYPDLSIMARDVLSVPITTVASESAFSIGDEDKLLKETISHVNSNVIDGTSGSGVVKL
ncbi:hypothetical protein KY290_013595 [Solanum tuberosum]|uniref:HAT C-terminal dimerisation domain-containing protein n=1 Tax=Solanum tuberosum TaxID=4113 RepID=A0ABQ7VM61_SOLTU|nr:hypothetical protein KY289_013722 [Solanum tuberosum]KAH0717042.1 hypothetical protein KY285_013073 [Solanum tuberosum]KAH0769614.1 hypothetical protein KY290_013595 [Solanum tuberosum]